MTGGDAKGDALPHKEAVKPQAAMAGAEQHRYIELDALRGLAALSVFICHALWVPMGNAPAEYARYIPLHLIAAGHEAVMLFFVLSGFVLSVPFHLRPPGYLQYIVKRIVRIYLPFAGAVSLAVLGCYFFPHPVTHLVRLDVTWLNMPSRVEILKHYTLIGHFNFNALDQVVWSLAHEMRISLVFPVIFWMAKRMRRWWQMPCVVLATVAVRALLDTRHMKSFEPSPLDISLTVLYAGFFLLGVVLFLNLHGIGMWLERQSRWMRAGCAGAAFLLYEFGEWMPRVEHLPRTKWSIAVYAVTDSVGDWMVALGAAGILLAAIYAAPLRHLLHWRPMRHLGAVSYSLYLIHTPVLFVLIALMWGRVWVWWIVVAAVPCTAVVTEIFYRVVEKPSTGLGRALGRAVARDGGGRLGRSRAAGTAA